MSTNLKKINRLIDVKAMALKASQLILGTAIVVASSSATADLRLRDNGTVYSCTFKLVTHLFRFSFLLDLIYIVFVWKTLP